MTGVTEHVKQTGTASKMSKETRHMLLKPTSKFAWLWKCLSAIYIYIWVWGNFKWDLNFLSSETLIIPFYYTQSVLYSSNCCVCSVVWRTLSISLTGPASNARPTPATRDTTSMAAAGTPGAQPTSPSTPPRCSRKVSRLVVNCELLAFCVTCFREVSSVCPMLHMCLCKVKFVNSLCMYALYCTLLCFASKYACVWISCFSSYFPFLPGTFLTLHFFSTHCPPDCDCTPPCPAACLRGCLTSGCATPTPRPGRPPPAATSTASAPPPPTPPWPQCSIRPTASLHLSPAWRGDTVKVEHECRRYLNFLNNHDGHWTYSIK